MPDAPDPTNQPSCRVVETAATYQRIRTCHQCIEKKFYPKIRSQFPSSDLSNLVPVQFSECWRCPASKAKLVECTCGNNWSARSDPDANVVTVVPPQHQQPDEEEVSEEELRRYIAANPDMWLEAVAKAEREISLEEKEKGKEGETTTEGQDGIVISVGGTEYRANNVVEGVDGISVDVTFPTLDLSTIPTQWLMMLETSMMATSVDALGIAPKSLVFAPDDAGGTSVKVYMTKPEAEPVPEEDITAVGAAAVGCLPGCINPKKGLHHRRCPNFLQKLVHEAPTKEEADTVGPEAIEWGPMPDSAALLKHYTDAMSNDGVVADAATQLMQDAPQDVPPRRLVASDRVVLSPNVASIGRDASGRPLKVGVVGVLKQDDGSPVVDLRQSQLAQQAEGSQFEEEEDEEKEKEEEATGSHGDEPSPESLPSFIKTSFTSKATYTKWIADRKLWRAVRDGNLDGVESLLESNADPLTCKCAETGVPVIFLATVKGLTSIAEQLLKRNADPNQRTSALHASHSMRGSQILLILTYA